MTSALSSEDGGASKLKEKLLNENGAKEDARSFLNFSRENLNICHVDLEEALRKQRFRPKKETIISAVALLVALLCFALETWKLRCSLVNAREIEELKRDVKSLKHRFLQQDLLDELKAFEEQLYATESTDEEEQGEIDIDNADYDSNYDEDSSSHDYSTDYIHSTSDSPNSVSTNASTTSSPTSVATNLALDETSKQLVASLHRAEVKRGRSKDDSAEQREDRAKVEEEEEVDAGNLESHVVRTRRSVDRREEGDLPRNEEETNTNKTVPPLQRNQGKRNFLSTRFLVNNKNISTSSRERHPPKKYYVHASLDPSHGPLSASPGEAGHSTKRSSTEVRNVGQNPDWRQQIHQNSNSETISRHLRRVMNRRHLRPPRQVCAIHYGADSTLFSEEDEHVGNGKARHSEGVFKAWKPSDWVADLGMNKHFSLAHDGKVTVHESGLYLVYAQIHYLDEHDENGFHLLVNGRPILQCMVFSPGIGHKSRSCFSAQATVLQANDVLVLKDVGSARYTLFQHDKSFFGLVKVGESRVARHQPSQSPPQ